MKPEFITFAVPKGTTARVDRICKRLNFTKEEVFKIGMMHITPYVPSKSLVRKLRKK